MTTSRLFRTTLRIQPQLNSTQTTELGTTQLKFVLAIFFPTNGPPCELEDRLAHQHS